MADEAVRIALDGNIKRGLALALAARERARDAANPSAELAALNAASRCHSMNNNASAALSSGIDAFTLAVKLNDVQAQAHALCSVASSAFVMRLLNESLPVAERACTEAVALRDDDLEARARMVYAENLSDLLRFDEADYQLGIALEAVRRLGDAAFENRLIASLATLNGKQAQYYADLAQPALLEEACATALALAEVVLPRAQLENNVTMIVSMLGLKARIKEFRGQLAEARDETVAVLAIAAKAKYLSPIPPWSLRLASLNARLGDPARARSALEDGLKAAETLRPSFRIGELFAALVELEHLAGNTAAEMAARQRAEEERRSFDIEREQSRLTLTARNWLRKPEQ